MTAGMARWSSASRIWQLSHFPHPGLGQWDSAGGADTCSICDNGKAPDRDRPHQAGAASFLGTCADTWRPPAGHPGCPWQSRASYCSRGKADHVLRGVRGNDRQRAVLWVSSCRLCTAALMRQHRIVFLQGYPVGLLEIFLTELDTNLFGINGILLHFATPLGRDFLLMGLPIGNAISESLCSTDGIHCTFLFAFTLTHEILPHQFCPAGAIPPETGRAKPRDVAAQATPRFRSPVGLVGRRARKVALRDA